MISLGMAILPTSCRRAPNSRLRLRVNTSYPSLRFFARNLGALSTVLVSLVYKAPLLGLLPLLVGPVLLSSQWEPSLPMLTLAAVPSLLTGGTSQVALRFTALTGSSQIDDVFVDPRMRW
jgi:hypothetical protein